MMRKLEGKCLDEDTRPNRSLSIVHYVGTRAQQSLGTMTVVYLTNASKWVVI
jgi:hypothetical protein